MKNRNKYNALATITKILTTTAIIACVQTGYATESHYSSSYASGLAHHRINLAKIDDKNYTPPTLEFKNPGYQEIEIINDTSQTVTLKDIYFSGDKFSINPVQHSIYTEGFAACGEIPSGKTCQFRIEAAKNASASNYYGSRQFFILYGIDKQPEKTGIARFKAKISYNNDLSFQVADVNSQKPNNTNPSQETSYKKSRHLVFTIDQAPVTKKLKIINDNPITAINIKNIRLIQDQRSANFDEIKIDNYSHCERLEKRGDKNNYCEVSVTASAAALTDAIPIEITYNTEQDSTAYILATAAIKITNIHWSNKIPYFSPIAYGLSREGWKELCRVTIKTAVSYINTIPHVAQYIAHHGDMAKIEEAALSVLLTSIPDKYLIMPYPTMAEHLAPTTTNDNLLLEAAGKTMAAFTMKQAQQLIPILHRGNNQRTWLQKLTGYFPGTYICNLASSYFGGIASKKLPIPKKGEFLPEKDNDHDEDDFWYNHRSAIKFALKRSIKIGCRWGINFASLVPIPYLQPALTLFSDPEFLIARTRGAGFPNSDYFFKTIVGDVATISIDLLLGEATDREMKKSQDKLGIIDNECTSSECFCREIY